MEARLNKDIFQAGKLRVYFYTEEGVGEETQRNLEGAVSWETAVWGMEA